MRDEMKTKRQLIEELTECKKKIEELETEEYELNKLAKALKVSEQKFRAIFDKAIDGILLADAETKKLSDCNDIMCKMTGYSMEEIKI